ncbi:MAG: hypothetical protein KJ645_03575 [Planctomycetes bacterium]|nr:hypothetical protein [Planctomycetota bacterium]
MRRPCIFLLLLLIGLVAPFPAAVAREATPETLQIHKGIPSDYFLMVRGMHNPERDFLNPYYEKLGQAFEKSKILDSLWKIFQADADAQAQEAVQGLKDQYEALFKAMDWKAFMANDWVFGVKTGYPAYQCLALFRMSAKTASTNYIALRTLLSAMAESYPFMQLENWTDGETQGTTVRFGELGVSFEPTLILAEGMLVFSTELADAKKAAALALGKETEAKPLVETQRFQKALAELPAAEDNLFYMEFEKIFSCFDGVEEVNASPIIQWGEDTCTLEEFMHILYPYCILPESIASVSYTEGRKSCEESVEIYCSDWKTRPAAGLCRGDAAIESFERFVPENASSFSIDTGINWPAVPDLLTGLFKEITPTGAQEILPKWEGMQQAMGVRLKEDVLALLEGGMMSLSMPAAQPTPFGDQDSIFLLPMKDSQKAQAFISQWVEMFSGMLDMAANLSQNPDVPPEAIPPLVKALAQSNIKVKLLPLEVDGVSWGKKINLSVMPFMQPAFGMLGKYLVIASSEGAIKSYAAFLEKGEPNILSNKGFKNIGMHVPAHIRSISFEDIGGKYAGMGQFLAMSGMLTMMIPNEPELQIVKKIAGLLPRLAPVVQALSFMGLETEYTVFDAEKSIKKSRKVSTYRIKAAEEGTK